MAFIEVEKRIYENEWAMHDLHSHPYYEFYCLINGSRSFFLSNALYKLDAPAIVVIPPHVMHKTEGGAFERYNVNVSPDYLDEYQRETLTEKSLLIIKPKTWEQQEILSLLQQLERVDKRQKHADAIIKTLFSYFALTIFRIDGLRQAPSYQAQNGIPPLILKVIDYIHSHYADKQTLEGLSRTFFVAQPTLIYNFKKYTNCSLMDFLLNVRLTKAKELLLNTKKSVSEIAGLCGFSSSNYFSLIFKRKENLSPANYRKHQLAKK